MLSSCIFRFHLFAITLFCLTVGYIFLLFHFFLHDILKLIQHTYAWSALQNIIVMLFVPDIHSESICLLPTWSVRQKGISYHLLIRGWITTQINTLPQQFNWLAPGGCSSDIQCMLFQPIVQYKSMGTCFEIALRWTSQNIINKKSMMAQVVAITK